MPAGWGGSGRSPGCAQGLCPAGGLAPCPHLALSVLLCTITPSSPAGRVTLPYRWGGHPEMRGGFPKVTDELTQGQRRTPGPKSGPVSFRWPTCP